MSSRSTSLAIVSSGYRHQQQDDDDDDDEDGDGDAKERTGNQDVRYMLNARWRECSELIYVGNPCLNCSEMAYLLKILD